MSVVEVLELVLPGARGQTPGSNALGTGAMRMRSAHRCPQRVGTLTSGDESTMNRKPQGRTPGSEARGGGAAGGHLENQEGT